MLLILIGMLAMFSFTLFLRYIITFSTEYISLLLFSLTFIFMIYAKNYAVFDKTLLNIIVPGILAVSLNCYLIDKIRSKKIYYAALIINSIIVLSGFCSVICYIFFQLPFTYFLISLFIFAILFLGIIIYYRLSERDGITFYNITTILIFIFLLLSFIHLTFLMLFHCKSGFLNYIPIIIFIFIIEFLYSFEKKELLYKLDKNKNDDTLLINIRADEYSFTDREKEISYLLLNRKTSKQIAYTLCLSINTVNWHIQNMYKKLSVSNKTDFTNKISQ